MTETVAVLHACTEVENWGRGTPDPHWVAYCACGHHTDHFRLKRDALRALEDHMRQAEPCGDCRGTGRQYRSHQDGATGSLVRCGPCKGTGRKA